MDGTQYASIAISQAKARTAALYRRPSKVLEDAVNTGGRPSVLSLMGMTGAIGASGDLSSQNGVTARAELVAIGGK